MRTIPIPGGFEAMVDAEKESQLKDYKWYLHSGYPARHLPRTKPRTRFMHHEILPPKKGFYIDHINGDRLDNRIKNLRYVTCQQNNFNRGKNLSKISTAHKGVYWSKEKALWIALIKMDGKSIHLGYFTNADSAAQAYNAKATEKFGEYARLNAVELNAEWYKNRVFVRSNLTSYRGVIEQKPGYYQVRLTVEGKRQSLGYFKTPEDAAKAYNQAALKHFGERALLNNIQ